MCQLLGVDMECFVRVRLVVYPWLMLFRILQWCFAYRLDCIVLYRDKIVISPTILSADIPLQQLSAIIIRNKIEKTPTQ